MRIFVLMGTVFYFISCSAPVPENPPSDLINKEEFTNIMVDVQLIEGMKIHKLGPKRSKSPDMEQMYSHIFQAHSISQNEFQKTYDHYKSRPDEMEGIYEAVLDSLSKLDVEVKKIYNAPQKLEEQTNLDSIRDVISSSSRRLKTEKDLVMRKTAKAKSKR